MMVEPASPVPVRIGVVTLVRLSPRTPLSEADDSTGAGVASGLVVSIVRDSVVDTAETLPAASVEVVVIGCTPSASTGDVKVHVPLAATTAVPSNLKPS